ncbi:hypothetical protein OF001_U130011 [Pseudomonas sp. OF001]|nr:hypothetical protein OF001_U130011 [Pseudomonas sp. OF001]
MPAYTRWVWQSTSPGVSNPPRPARVAPATRDSSSSAIGQSRATRPSSTSTAIGSGSSLWPSKTLTSRHSRRGVEGADMEWMTFGWRCLYIQYERGRRSSTAATAVGPARGCRARRESRAKASVARVVGAGWLLVRRAGGWRKETGGRRCAVAVLAGFACMYIHLLPADTARPHRGALQHAQDQSGRRTAAAVEERRRRNPRAGRGAARRRPRRLRLAHQLRAGGQRRAVLGLSRRRPQPAGAGGRRPAPGLRCRRGAGTGRGCRAAAVRRRAAGHCRTARWPGRRLQRYDPPRALVPPPAGAGAARPPVSAPRGRAGAALLRRRPHRRLAGRRPAVRPGRRRGAVVRCERSSERSRGRSSGCRSGRHYARNRGRRCARRRWRPAAVRGFGTDPPAAGAAVAALSAGAAGAAP